MLTILLGLLFISVLCLLAATAYIHKRQFAYDVKRDYRYDELVVSERLTLQNGLLTIPSSIKTGDTVIAKIHVKSGWFGMLRMPWIDVRSKGGRWKKYVEYGANGVRYLNLSDTFSDKDRTLFLQGRRLTLSNQEIEISAYPREDLAGKKILVLAPHADDAELSAYGLYEKYASDSMIVTVTASEGGSFHYGNLYQNHTEIEAQHLQKGRMRVWNSLTVPLLAGVPSDNIIQLGFFDSTLDTMRQNPDAEIKSTKLDTADVNIFRKANTSPLAKNLKGKSTWNDLVDNLAYLIETFQPDVIVTPSPNIDAHKDHQNTTIAAVEALRKLNYSKGSLFMHTLHYLTDDFPIGKFGSMLGLPPRFDKPFYFQSIYSNPLSKEEQNRKLLALDAMNDIRPNANGYMHWPTMLLRGLNHLRHQLFNIDRDLVNRFVRSNELFYVVPVSDVHQDETYRKIIHQG